ncbi:uncharacterized protein J3R85_013508 [Psidium guajava]|nr:uncharacterized protein J3R85_013508 [Psidium guajava]
MKRSPKNLKPNSHSAERKQHRPSSPSSSRRQPIRSVQTTEELGVGCYRPSSSSACLRLRAARRLLQQTNPGGRLDPIDRLHSIGHSRRRWPSPIVNTGCSRPWPGLSHPKDPFIFPFPRASATFDGPNTINPPSSATTRLVAPPLSRSHPTHHDNSIRICLLSLLPPPDCIGIATSLGHRTNSNELAAQAFRRTSVD